MGGYTEVLKLKGAKSSKPVMAQCQNLGCDRRGVQKQKNGGRCQDRGKRKKKVKK